MIRAAVVLRDVAMPRTTSSLLARAVSPPGDGASHGAHPRTELIMTRHGAGRAHVSIPRALSILALAFGLCPAGAFAQDRPLTINDKQYFEKRGLNVLVFTNEYNGMFFDEKTAGIEIIHHGVRTATGGAVRLGPTPEQWDQIPKVVDRKVDPKSNTIEVTLRYEAFDFDSRVVVTPDGAGFRIAVFLDKPRAGRARGPRGAQPRVRAVAVLGAHVPDGRQAGDLPALPGRPDHVASAREEDPAVRGALHVRPPRPRGLRRGSPGRRGEDPRDGARGPRAPRRDPVPVG